MTWSQRAAQFYLHCATIHTNLHGGTTDASQPTHFPILFSKKFQKFFGPFPRAPGAHTHHFRIPLLPLYNLNFFRRFDLNSRFLLHGTSFHLLLGLVNIFFRSKVQNSPYRGYYYSQHATTFHNMPQHATTLNTQHGSASSNKSSKNKPQNYNVHCYVHCTAVSEEQKPYCDTQCSQNRVANWPDRLRSWLAQCQCRETDSCDSCCRYLCE